MSAWEELLDASYQAVTDADDGDAEDFLKTLRAYYEHEYLREDADGAVVSGGSQLLLWRPPRDEDTDNPILRPEVCKDRFHLHVNWQQRVNETTERFVTAHFTFPHDFPPGTSVDNNTHTWATRRYRGSKGPGVTNIPHDLAPCKWFRKDEPDLFPSFDPKSKKDIFSKVPEALIGLWNDFYDEILAAFTNASDYRWRLEDQLEDWDIET